MIDSITERLVQRNSAEGAILCEQHRSDLVDRIHPEQSVRSAVPEELTDLAGGFGSSFRPRNANSEIITETHLPFARKPGNVRDFAGHCIARHQSYGRGLQNARAIELTIIQQHASKAHVVIECRRETPAARL